MNQEKLPHLFTLNAMAARLAVPAKWLQEQAEIGKVPAVATGKGYLFSLVPTVRAIGKMAECTIRTLADAAEISEECRGDE